MNAGIPSGMLLLPDALPIKFLSIFSQQFNDLNLRNAATCQELTRAHFLHRVLHSASPMFPPWLRYTRVLSLFIRARHGPHGPQRNRRSGIRAARYVTEHLLHAWYFELAVAPSTVVDGRRASLLVDEAMASCYSSVMWQTGIVGI